MSTPPYKPPAAPFAPLLPNPLGLAALWVGIGAFVAALIPFASYFAIVVAFVGLVLGVIALVLPRRRKKAATAGSIVSFVALIVSIGTSIFYTVVLFGSLIAAITGSNTPPPPSAPLGQSSIPLTYGVDGTGSDVDITYTTFVNGIDETELETGQRLPFEREFEVAYGGADTYNSYTLTAVNGDNDGDVTCRIALDDRVLIERTATGPFATATCTASGTELLE